MYRPSTMKNFPQRCIGAVITLLAMTFAGCSMPENRASQAASVPGPVVVTIAAFNDFHGNINPPKSPTRIPDPQSPGKLLALPTGGVEYLSSAVAQIKARNELNVVVAAGDLIGGSPLASALFHHEPSIELLSLLGLEFSSVGNHEFDAGRVELLRMQQGGCFPGGKDDTCRNNGFAGARFSYLAANVIDTQTGKSLLAPYAVKKFSPRGRSPFEMAFIGLVLEDTPGIVMPSGIKGLKFIGEAQAANALVPEIRARGIESIVVLIHEGGYTTADTFDDQNCPGFTGKILRIMDELDPAIDLVISGHTHKAYICRHGGRLVTSAGMEGRIVTDIDVSIDPSTGNVTNATAHQVAAVNDTAINPLPQRYPTLPKDSRLSQLVSFYNAQAAPLVRREVGRITGDIEKHLTSTGESPLGNLVADAQLAATQSAEAGSAQMAFVNSTGLRADLRSNDGRVSYNDVFSVHPFGNGLITLTLTGAQLDQMLEEQWLSVETMLQGSKGFTYEWRASAPIGQRVDSASIRLNGVAIDPAKSYRVTVNDFLAQGGDNFAVFKSGTDQQRGVPDVQALETYLAQHSPLSPPATDRVTRLP